MINDSLGHEVGDLILCEVSERLRQLCLENSTLCRFGGDEFVIVVGRAINEIEANHTAANIVDSLSTPFANEHHNTLLVSASVGYAAYPTHSRQLDDIIRFADAAMYASKKRGKKRWTQYTPGMDRAILRRSLLAQYLSAAIENDELSLHFQPVIDVNSGAIHSFEALLRWHHAELGHINPQELIAIAQEIGLIQRVENWVIKTALASLPRLRKKSDANASIAINVSALHLVNPELPPFLLAQLEANQLKSNDVILEITESLLLDNIETNNSAIEAITDLGIQLSIDDFGTGYSSLAYLHNINASIVKIDKAFLSQTSGSEVTLSAINNLVKSMNMTTLIEGVETQANADLCKTIGINLHQGYFYSRPKPIDEI